MLLAVLMVLVVCGCVSSESKLQCTVSTMKIVLSSHYNQSGHWQSQVEIAQGLSGSLTSNKWHSEVEQRTEDCEENQQVLRTIIHLKVPTSAVTAVKPWVDVLVPDGYKKVEGVGVVKTSSSVKSLAEATGDCAKDGAFLMVMDSAAKIDYANLFMSRPETFKGAANDRDIWTGVQVVGGEWTTVQGVLLTDVAVFLWAAGRPVDGHCAVFAKHIQSHWDSNACGSPGTRLSYICEMPRN